MTSWTDRGSAGTPLIVGSTGNVVGNDPSGLASGKAAVITNAGKHLSTNPTPTASVFAVARTAGSARQRVVSAATNWLLGWPNGKEASTTPDLARRAVLDAAGELFYARGIGCVGMAEVRDTSGRSLRRL